MIESLCFRRYNIIKSIRNKWHSITERGEREKRLYNASLSGNVESLTELMQEDELSLARVTITCFNETPLHIAAMLGHVEFAEALVKYNSSLVSELDLQHRSPLHLASANGYVEMVKLLLLVDPNLCGVRDEDGRTPLHLAAVKSRVEVLNELTRFRPEVIRYKLRQGETILHSCVICNRLEALKQIVEADEDFVNVPDQNGNTILHTAALLTRIEVVKYLVSRSEVRVDEKNSKGLTALDIIQQMPRDLKSIEIQELLQSTAQKGNALPAFVQDDTQQIEIRDNASLATTVEKNVTTSRANQRDSIFIAATLIAGMAYQAGHNPPCGVWQGDQYYNFHGHNTKFAAGTSIMAVRFPNLYFLFMTFNTLSFFASLGMMLLLISGLHLKDRVFTLILTISMWVTVIFMCLTYVFSTQAITPKNEGFTHKLRVMLFVSSRSVDTWFVVVVFFIFVHFIVSVIKRKRRVSTDTNRGQGQRNANEGDGQGQSNANEGDGQDIQSNV